MHIKQVNSSAKIVFLHFYTVEYLIAIPSNKSHISVKEFHGFDRLRMNRKLIGFVLDRLSP
jgi:hypothetical protein